MLRCHCQIIGTFTKKTSVLRYDPVLTIPSGCHFHKAGIVFFLGKTKSSNKLNWKDKHFPYKEQRNILWTSLYFLKDNKSNDSFDKWNTHKADSTITGESETADKIKNTNNTLLVSHTDKSGKIGGKNTGEVHQIDSTNNEKNTSTKNFVIKGEVNKSEADENVLMRSKNNQTAEKIKQNTENFKIRQTSLNVTLKKIKGEILDAVILSKKKISNSPVSPNGVTGISDIQKKLDKLGSQELMKHDKETLEMQNRREDVKRTAIELKLGELTGKENLTPSETFAYEKERPSSENKLFKETPQKLLLEKAKGILRKTATLKPDDDRNVRLVNLGTPRPETSLNINTRRRQTVDLNRCSTERNFITPVRAMTDFLLKPSDLEGLRKTKRRSPYENDPPITVYWRKDVEAKALDVWGSKENLLKEILKRDIERRRYQQNLFTVKRRLRDYRREQSRETEVKLEKNGLLGSSGKVVLTAIAINGTNFMFKLLAWLYTGSHSMFSEAVHSLADTINQLILAYGIHKSVQRADSDHPYGYTNMRYVASLISGVGIFCVGSGLSFYHGFMGLTDPSDLPSFYWAYFILAGSLASEGATLLVAFNSIRLGAKKYEMSFSEYVFRGQDPSVNVVLLEDAAAVIGVGFAGICMGLSSYFDSHLPDAVGCFLVGGLLAGVASFIIYTNVAALVGRSISQERLDKINAELESDVMIRAIHDVKGIDIGNSLVRYKAEMDFDGGELTRSYLDKQDLNQMLEEIKKMQTIDELEEFMLKHGENIVDMMGGEIDRIELKLRKKHPEIRHCDLEIL